MKIAFTKMHGIGNDYIYLNCMDGEPENPGMLAEKMSPRRFSVGADGVVLICRSEIADAKMRMFNADGSEGKMCGNAIRCVGKYLYDNGLTKKREIDIETLSGVKHLWLTVADGTVVSAAVNMGRAVFEAAKIPAISPSGSSEIIDEPVQTANCTYALTCVSMGNPHAVIFTDAVKDLALSEIGPGFERHPLFPERINTEFIRVISPSELEMRVWERGSGETFACGTGACASVAAAVKTGRCRADLPVAVHLPGGTLTITCGTDYTIMMEGPCAKSYDGVFEL